MGNTKLICEFQQDTDMESSGQEAMVSGNMRRDLWKKTCKAIANNVSSSTVRPHTFRADLRHVALQSALSDQERALYACLTGDLENTLPACQTWEDHLWAHLNTRLIVR